MSKKDIVELTDNGDGTYSVPIESVIPCFNCKNNLNCNGDCFYRGYTLGVIAETENGEETIEFSPPEFIQRLVELAENKE